MVSILKRIAIFVAVWVISYTIYSLIILPVILDSGPVLSPDKKNTLILTIISLCSFGGVFMGVIFGIFDFLYDRFFNRKHSFGLTVLVNIAFYCISTVLVFFIGMLIYQTSKDFKTEDLKGFELKLISIGIFSIFISVIFGFIKQLGRNIGPGNLFALFFGKFHKPKTEERFFMFLDLRSSTTIAEKTGHLRFTELIQDCFYDLNSILSRHKADIYKYVGDEAIVTWTKKDGMLHGNCIGFFFSFTDLMASRHDYYLKTYGVTPTFKAGLNFGAVTVTEVGDIKREIAYYGDVLNTAARIQSVCNEYGRDFLVSGDVMTTLGNPEPYEAHSVGEIMLKGKETATTLYFLDR